MECSRLGISGVCVLNCFHVVKFLRCIVSILTTVLPPALLVFLTWFHPFANDYLLHQRGIVRFLRNQLLKVQCSYGQCRHWNGIFQVWFPYLLLVLTCLGLFACLGIFALTWLHCYLSLLPKVGCSMKICCQLISVLLKNTFSNCFLTWK